MRTTLTTVLGVLCLALAIAGCPGQQSGGGGSADGATETSTQTPPTGSESGTTGETGSGATSTDSEDTSAEDSGSETESGDAPSGDADTLSSDDGGDSSGSGDTDNNDSNDSGDSDTSGTSEETNMQSSNGESDTTGTGPYQGLTPVEGADAPDLTEVTEVTMETGAGNLTVEVYPQAAPQAAERFTTLVEEGYYDDTPIFRVIDNFVAQFGINWRDDYSEWREKTIEDEPAKFRLERGTLSFAKTSQPDSASTQIFINLKDNTSNLRPQGFTVFGQIVEGQSVLEDIKRVQIRQQGALWERGGEFLDQLSESRKPTMINSAELAGE